MPIFSPRFSHETRPELLRHLTTEIWDAIVIGGGITGAAVARDAALRGLKVALIEASDFAGGTSSGSSKLIHGGVRYLEQFEFKLVFEAIREREKLKKIYAPLVRDLAFVFPTYRNIFPPKWKLNLGLFLYDAFAKFRAPHLNLSRQNAIQKFPWLVDEQLTGACVYTDSFSEDYRLVIELIKSSFRHGAVAVSRMEVLKINSGNIHELLVKDRTSQKQITVKTKAIFNCSGPFSDRIRALFNLPPALRLTQGVHFVVPRERLPLTSAFVLPDPQLHRIMFAIPWNQITYLGTTDTDVDRPEDARASAADLAYVLKIANKYFNTKLERKDVIQSWSAVRPLLRPPDLRTASQVSREHHCEENPKNVFHLMGGKLTSHRVMAREAVDRLTSNPTKDDLPLQDILWESSRTTRLEKTFGRYANDILKIDELAGLRRRTLSPAVDHLAAEVFYSIHHEMALEPIDFIRRRSSLYYENPTIDMAQAVTEIFSRQLGWSDEVLETHLGEIKRQFAWDKENY
jgi:glycerol-3-phosphate dehydrogenase